MVDLEIPNNAAGISNKTFVVKLHVILDSGKLLIAESKKKSISEAIKEITKEIDNQSRSTDRQKHPDSFRKHG